MAPLYAGAGLVALVLFGGAPAAAQSSSLFGPQPAAQPVTLDSSFTPLSLRQKVLYTENEVFGAPHLLQLTFVATLQQFTNQPRDWGWGSDAFGVRLASELGRSLIRQNIALGVRAFDREDPRYFLLGHGTHWHRVRNALAQAVIARNDNGGWMPAYSRFVADYGMPFIAQQWNPYRFRTVGQGLRAGTVGIGLAAVSNVCQEFWPDIRNKLRRRAPAWVASRFLDNRP